MNNINTWAILPQDKHEESNSIENDRTLDRNTWPCRWPHVKCYLRRRRVSFFPAYDSVKTCKIIRRKCTRNAAFFSIERSSHTRNVTTCVQEKIGTRTGWTDTGANNVCMGDNIIMYLNTKGSFVKARWNCRWKSVSSASEPRAQKEEKGTVWKDGNSLGKFPSFQVERW